MRTDSFSNETKHKYANTGLWKNWMEEIRLWRVETLSELEEYLEAHSESPVMAWDLETKSLDNTPENVCGHCISFTEDEAVYIPTQHINYPRKNLDHDTVFEMVFNAMESKEVAVYNWGFEGRVSRLYGSKLRAGEGGAIDVMVYRWLYDSDKKQFNLKDAASELCGHQMLEIHEVPGIKIGKRNKDIAFHLSDPDDATLYAAADPVFTLRILNKIREFVEKDQKFIVMMEHALLEELLEMQENPITIDRGYLRQAGKELDHWASVVAKRIYSTFGQEFNIGSNAEVGKHLADQGAPLKRTKTGKLATGADAISDLADDWPVVRDILFWRSLIKEKSSYVDALLNCTSEEHPEAVFKFRSVGAPTGRFASGGVDEGDPIFAPMNVQAIPSSSGYQSADCRLVTSTIPELR